MKNIAYQSFKYPKSARLRYRSLVEPLFQDGNSIYEYPLRLIWRRCSMEDLNKAFRMNVPDDIDPLQLLITIPKRRIRPAVRRVALRRKIREIWRINRLPLLNLLCQKNNIASLSVAVVYISNNDYSFQELENRFRILIDKLMEKI